MGHFKGFGKYAYKKQKPGYELHNFLDTGLKPIAGNRKVLLGISLIVIMLGGYLWSQDPRNGLFHSYEQLGGADPTTPIWKDSFINNDLGGWRTSFFASYSSTSSGTCTNVGNGVTSCKGVLLSPNSTNSAYALSKSPTGVSQAVNKVLVSTFWYLRTTATAMSAGMKWYFYLTTNGTLPLNEKTYDPMTDLSVGLILRETAISSTQGNLEFLLQKNSLQTIQSGEQSNCPLSSTCFQLLTGQTLPAQNNQLELTELMNETGAAGASPASGRSTLEQNDINLGTAGSADIFNLPWFDMNQQYYVGFWSVFGTAQLLMLSNIGSSGDCTGLTPTIFNCMSLIEYQPTVASFTTTIGPPPQIDTGGFFGPLIRAFISIGIFFLQSILILIGFLSGPLQTAGAFLASLGNIILGGLVGLLTSLLNTIGGWVGNPQLGTQIVSGFGAIGSFLTGVLTSIVALVGNLITFIQDMMLFLFDATNGLLTFWIGGILAFLTTLATIAGFIIQVIKLFQIGMPFIVLLDMVWLITETYDNGTEGAMKWWHPHEILVVQAGGLLLMLVEKLANFIYQSTLVVEEGVADIKPEIAGFSP